MIQCCTLKFWLWKLNIKCIYLWTPIQKISFWCVSIFGKRQCFSSVNSLSDSCCWIGSGCTQSNCCTQLFSFKPHFSTIKQDMLLNLFTNQQVNMPQVMRTFNWLTRECNVFYSCVFCVRYTCTFGVGAQCQCVVSDVFLSCLSMFSSAIVFIKHWRPCHSHTASRLLQFAKCC